MKGVLKGDLNTREIFGPGFVKANLIFSKID